MNTENPYQTPSSGEKQSKDKTSARFVIACGELIIVAAIVGIGGGFLLPAVEVARVA